MCVQALQGLYYLVIQSHQKNSHSFSHSSTHLVYIFLHGPKNKWHCSRDVLHSNFLIDRLQNAQIMTSYYQQFHQDSATLPYLVILEDYLFSYSRYHSSESTSLSVCSDVYWHINMVITIATSLDNYILF